MTYKGIEQQVASIQFDIEELKISIQAEQEGFNRKRNREKADHSEFFETAKHQMDRIKHDNEVLRDSA